MAKDKKTKELKELKKQKNPLVIDELDAQNQKLEENIALIRNKLDRRTLLEGLAEEAAELSQAALKVIRAENLSNNYTPVTSYEAREALKEELHDVMTMAYTLGILPGVFYPDYEKTERWAERLKKPPRKRKSARMVEED